MRVGKALAVLAEGALWRVSGKNSLGWRLIDALGEADENVRSIAGIMLAKGGRAAIPLLQRALAERVNVPLVLALLGDVGDATHSAEIANFVDDPDKTIARAAREALRVLALKYPSNQVV
jgi:HEAT repeat protein